MHTHFFVGNQPNKAVALFHLLPKLGKVSGSSSSTSNCIVLYLYIYIVLPAVHTNQKRFKCERPREKRAVSREQKEVLGSPVNKVDRVEGRSWFQSKGPMIAKARV